MAKISVNSLRGRLYLLGRLPAKDGTTVLKQARIPLKLDDTPSNQRIADKRRAALQRQVDQGTFSWDDWVDPTKGTTWRQAIDALYRKRVVLGRTGHSTWETNYMGRLRQLPMTKVVTSTEVAAAIQKYDRDQCSYKELYYLLKDLCALISVPFPEVPVPTYGDVKVIDVPSDAEIIDWVQAAPPISGWYFGIMATYGCRPHEVDGSQFLDDQHTLQIPDDTKTGFRVVIPLYPEWVELFDLRNERRRTVQWKSGMGPWLYNERKKLGINYKPYSLRHAFAARLWREGGSQMDIYTAARLMGHSVKEHERTYRAHIAPHTVATSALDAIARNQAARRKLLDQAMKGTQPTG